MNLPQLTKKPAICARGGHCAACRNKEGGRHVRHKLILPRAPELSPDGQEDFDCPFGHRWGDKPAPPAGGAARKSQISNLKSEIDNRDADRGPGTMVKLLLERLGIARDKDGRVHCPCGKIIKGCGCRAMEEKMNRWKIAGCILHGGEILSWFAAKAADCEISLDARSARQIIASAWRTWRKERSQREHL